MLTRMHSSRMRTGRTLTVFRKLETPRDQTPPPPRKFGADTPPPENLEQTPPSPRTFGADTPPTCGQNDTRF